MIPVHPGMGEIWQTPAGKDIEVVASLFGIFNAPWLIPATVYVQGPSMAAGAALVTSYYVYDGSWEGFVLAWIAAGTVFAVLDERRLAQQLWNGVFDEIDKIL